MLVVSQCTVADEAAGEFVPRAQAALAAYAACPGYVRGRLGRSVDDAERWLLVTEWDGVGSYRRALSAYDVKVATAPLLELATDLAGAYETVIADDGQGTTVRRSDRASDADIAGPGR